MKCLRCGYCCKSMMVIIVNDPAKGIRDGNLIANMGDGTPCKHLLGDKPGEYRCAIHHYKWYRRTPCFNHTQVEIGDTPCRTGVYMLKHFEEDAKESARLEKEAHGLIKTLKGEAK